MLRLRAARIQAGMSNDGIHVIAKIKAKSGKEAEVRGLLQKLVPAAQKEEGCMHYQLFEELRVPGSFYTFEQWSSEATLKQHLDGLQGVIADAMPMLDGAPEIRPLNGL